MLATKYKVLLARLAKAPVVAAHRALGRGPEVLVTRAGVRWRLDLNEGIDFAIYLLGMFERSTVAAYRRLVRPGDVVLDVGANIGAHALHLARLVGDGGKVVCFEPTRFAFEKLRANAALNPALAPRIVAEQVMLVESTATAPEPELFSSWPLESGPDLHQKHRGRSQTTAGARATTVDAYVAAAGLTHVDFIKMDVDGHECGVLRGALHTLRTLRPVMIMELSPYVLEETGHSVEELAEILAAAGYRLSEMGTERPLPMDGAALRRLVRDGASMNVLARSSGAASR